jgi:hypothetical protein
MQARPQSAPEPNSLVLQLQAETLSSASSATSLLRKAKAIASKLGLQEATGWVSRELDGYFGEETLPQYRLLGGTPQVLDHHHGWQPLLFESAHQTGVFSTVHLRDPIATLEAMAEGDPNRSFHKTFPPELSVALRNANSRTAIEFGTRFSAGQIRNVIETVKTLILNWTLELEKAGVLGEGMTFTIREREDAAPVTHQVFIQNVGVLGSVSSGAVVHNAQTANAQIDLKALQSFIAQARSMQSELPPPLRDQVTTALEGLEREGAAPRPNHSKLRELLTSIRTVAEGAAGNLVAMGIARIATVLSQS